VVIAALELPSPVLGGVATVWAAPLLLRLHVTSSSAPPPGTLWKVKVLVAQSCPTLCDLLDCSPPGSSVHGILQARILEWVAIPFSMESSWPRDRIQGSPGLQADSLWSEPPGTLRAIDILSCSWSTECRYKGKEPTVLLKTGAILNSSRSQAGLILASRELRKFTQIDRKWIRRTWPALALTDFSWTCQAGQGWWGRQGSDLDDSDLRQVRQGSAQRWHSPRETGTSSDSACPESWICSFSKHVCESQHLFLCLRLYWLIYCATVWNFLGKHLFPFFVCKLVKFFDIPHKLFASFFTSLCTINHSPSQSLLILWP